ncbi:MAG: class I SAM-dependent methyltransferase [Thiohalospira sp.]
MPRTAAFDAHPDRYDHWFPEHEAAWISELLALRPFVPWEGEGLEIGVGSGRFAAPLGIATGVDPSPAMLAHAAERGIRVVEGRAEALPWAEASFDHALVVTTLCFVDDAAAMLAEARRVLRPGGRLVLGFVDRGSPLGAEYLARQAQSTFYQEATFFSGDEVVDLLQGADLPVEAQAQTLFGPLNSITEIQPLRPGRGEGGFAVMAARRPE